MTTTALLGALVTGGLLVAIELARSVPAWLRVRRARSAAGVSAISIGVLAGTSLGWVAVAILTHAIAAAVATVLWLIFHMLLLKEVVALDRGVGKRITVTASISLGCVAIATAIGLAVGDVTTALGIAIGAASAAYSLPALVTGLRSRSTAGLSIASLSTNAVEGAIYLVAGLGWGGIAPPGRYIVAYLLFGGLALTSNVPRLVRTMVRRLSGKDSVGLDASRPTGS